MPEAYNDLDNLILSQFSSVTVIPDEIPRIWVCTAPATAVLQTSELLTTTDGELAVGGALSVTTVLLTVVFVSAANKGKDNNKNIVTNNFINYNFSTTQEQL